ncbi:MAG TPA: hypothetical protein VMI35_09995 [Puia sp.]|nr:hypothetical protein [Puia sp.]
MQQKRDRHPLFLIILVFILISLVLATLKWAHMAPGTDYLAMLSGNLLLFLVTLLSFQLYRKSLRNSNMQVFLRAMYGSLLLKMAICIAAVFVYVLLAGRSVSKLAIFVCFGFYFIYTFVEVKLLMRISKQNNA